VEPDPGYPLRNTADLQGSSGYELTATAETPPEDVHPVS